MTLALRRRDPAGFAGVPRPAPRPAVEPFHGPHQAGIATRQQAHTHFATFDLSAETCADLRAFLRLWTEAAAKLCAGLSPTHLTLTFGFGAGLFVKDGADRYGLAARRPEALVDLPAFAGDQLQPGRCGGDLSVQACADDPRIAFHAVYELAQLAQGAAHLRWAQSGFMPSLLGHAAPPPGHSSSQADMDAIVWVGDEGPAWMRGGTYVVPRRIRIALDPWDSPVASFPIPAIGRRSLAASSTDSASILRRGYSYDDADDSGLFFVAYQKDPRAGFIRLFDSMAKSGMVSQFAVHTGSAIFACPPGCAQGESIGDGVFD